MIVNIDPRTHWAARAAALRNMSGVFMHSRPGAAYTDRHGTEHYYDRDRMSPEARALVDEQAELVAQQGRLIDRNTQTFETADGQRIALTPEERQQIERRLGQIEQLQARIDEIDDELSRPGVRRTPANAGERPTDAALAARGAGRSAGRVAPVVNLGQPYQRATVESVFGIRPVALASLEALKPEDRPSRYVNALVMRDSQYLMSMSLQMSGANTQVGAEGGFATPVAWSGILLTEVFAQSFFLSRCRVVPMEADRQTFPMLNSYNRTKGPGALIAEKKGEGAAATAQGPLLEEATLVAHKDIVYIPMTQEMVQGAGPGTEAAIIAAMAGTIAMSVDRGVWSGSGVASMLGITTDPATITQTKRGSQAASSILYGNLVDMLSRLHPSSYKNSIWVASPSTLPQLLSVYQPVTTVAGSENVGGIAAPITQMADGSYAIFGRPDVLERLPTQPASRIDELLAHRWRAP